MIRSLPSLGQEYPPVGDERWSKIADDFLDYMMEAMPDALSVWEVAGQATASGGSHP